MLERFQQTAEMGILGRKALEAVVPSTFNPSHHLAIQG
jgi:hypothetical protein